MTKLPISEIIKQAMMLVGLDEPSGTLVTSTDKDIKKMFMYALKVGRELREMPFSQLKRTHTITTSASDNQYPLPQDFFRMLSGTQWDQTNSWRMQGPLNDVEFNAFLYGIVTSHTRKRYRIFGYDPDGGEIFIDPTPSGTETISFDYIRSQWIFPAPWTGSTVVAGASYRSANGNIYIASGAGTTGGTRPSHDTGIVSDGGVFWTHVTNALYGDATQRFQEDTDIVLFDDDLFIDGLVYYYLNNNGYEDRAKQYDWESKKTSRLTRKEGAEILSFASTGINQLLSYDNLPDGDFG